MRIGLDFDNTIVCYDQAISRLADELFHTPEEVPRTKLGLRDYLRSEGRESEWTAFQGQLYGPGMRHARPFKGANEAILKLTSEGHDFVIVSHRTKEPYEGPKYDLHGAAHEWIYRNLNGDHKDLGGSFDIRDIYFLESLDEKIEKIRDLECDVFVDDLESVLLFPMFPERTIPIHFDPLYQGTEKVFQGMFKMTRWCELVWIIDRQ